MGKLVLVAEEEPGVAQVIKRVLQSEDYEIHIVHDGQAALDCWSEHDYQLLITNYGMPKIDGCQLVQKLRSKGITVPIIMMSGGNITNLEAVACGASDFLAKPFSFEDLRTKVKQFLP